MIRRGDVLDAGTSRNRDAPLSAAAEDRLAAAPGVRIGIAPADAVDRHRAILDALAEALFVRFEPYVRFEPADDAGPDGLRALIQIGEDEPADLPAGLPSLRLPDRLAPAEQLVEDAIRLTLEPGVPMPLRGRTLTERTPPRLTAREPWPHAAPLALSGARPVWWAVGHDGLAQVSRYALPSLTDGSVLRSELCSERFMSLLPVVALLMRACGADREIAPLGACVVFDDPNLHWPSYGHIHYRSLIGHARACGYHVSFATVPRDAWFAHRGAAALIRENPAQISLAVHGNDHTSHELGRLVQARDAELAMAQALRRVTALERRAGVRVDRVMVPPHGRCSEQAVRAMLHVGFEAASIGHPHPWRGSEPSVSTTLGWRAAEFVGGGLPVLPRIPISHRSDELIFRALLRQPLIVYGHHNDLAGGYQSLERVAAQINSFGAVRWGSLAAIARSNATGRVEARTLIVELGSRRATIRVPAGVDRIAVRIPPTHGGVEWTGVRTDMESAPLRPATWGWESDPIALDGRSQVELALVGARSLDPTTLDAPAPRVWPLTRRLLVEQRDRAAALMAGGAERRDLRDESPGGPGPRRVTMLLENNTYPHDTRVRNEAETLVADRRRVTVIAPRGSGQAAREVIAGVRVWRFRCPMAGGSAASLLGEYAVAHVQLIARAAAEVALGTEALHVHGPPDTVAVLCAPARLLGRRVVFDLHDSAPELADAKFGARRALRAALLVWQRAALAAASHVIVTNQSQRDLVEERAPRAVGVSVVRNGPRAVEFQPGSRPSRAGGLAAPRLVYVGALDVQDGVLELVDLLTMPELKRATLTVIGDGPLRTGIETRAVAAGVPDRISFAGQVAHRRVPALIADADICIDPAPCTALNHGSTMIKVAEYLAVGRPLVAYRLRETERTAGDAALYARCGDLEEFARHVRRLADDDGLRGELGAQAQARAQRLMWERSAAVLRTVYAEL